MKKIYIEEKWCLGCKLCEYNCAFVNTGQKDMARALKDKEIYPRIKVEGHGDVAVAVNCRHCDEPFCVYGCITGAITKEDGVVKIDSKKCVKCLTCVLSCPVGALSNTETGVMQKCELCQSLGVKPVCVKGCPNRAIVFEERSEL